MVRQTNTCLKILTDSDFDVYQKTHIDTDTFNLTFTNTVTDTDAVSVQHLALYLQTKRKKGVYHTHVEEILKLLQHSSTML